MPSRLPLIPSVANYRFGTDLGGEQFLIDVRWNDRAGAWYLDLYTEDEEPIYSGIKVVLGAILGGRCSSDRFPDGAFVAADLSGAGRDAQYDDLGVRVDVLFYSSSELP